MWMPGLWDVKITADDGVSDDDATFRFCVQG